MAADLVFTIDGEAYPFEMRFMYAEAVLIKHTLGMGMTDFSLALNTGDPEAIGMLVWLAKRRRDGQHGAGAFGSLDFDLTAVLEALEEPDESEPESEPDES